VFKRTGFESITAKGADAALDAILTDYQNQAKAGDKRLLKKLNDMFGKDAENVLTELANGDINDNTVSLVYSRYLDFVPATLSEKPTAFATAGNSRVFWTLKSYTIKQFDVYRNEVFREIHSGEKERVVQGMKNLVRLTAFLMMLGIGADELKDLVLGRKTDWNDRLVDNILKIFGVSKYITWQARREGLGKALMQQIAPPISFVDKLSKDVGNIGNPNRYPKNEHWYNNVDTMSSIPIIGKIYYWREGRGTEQHKELYEIRFTKEKQDLNEIKDELEQLDDNEKTRFKIRHAKEFRRLKQANHIQGQLSKLKHDINLQRAKPNNPARERIIEGIEKQRERLMVDFMRGIV
jgi:hypothetical protein